MAVVQSSDNEPKDYRSSEQQNLSDLLYDTRPIAGQCQMKRACRPSTVIGLGWLDSRNAKGDEKDGV